MTSNRLLNRYLPFLAIAGLQLILVATQPAVVTTGGPVTGVAGAANGAAAAGAYGADGQGTFADGSGGFDSGANGGSGFNAGGAASGAAGSAGGATSGAAGAVRTGGGAAGGAPSASGQRLDALGRPLDGDRSRCAEGGLVQVKLIRRQIPCVPEYVGDNGGATWQGVTRDEIVAVVWFHKPNEETDTVLASQGFAISPEQNAEINQLFEQFFNKHYMLYGRKLRIEQFVSQCDASDLECHRVEAKVINDKFKPFVVVNDVGAQTPRLASEEFARLGVVVAGAQYGIGNDWFRRMAPFAWTYQTGGTEAANLLSDYYCKKLSGKNATLAGDPQLTTKKRKLGIVVSEDPSILERGNQIKAQVTGGRCGAAGDAIVYTLSTDSARAAEQAGALATRMKADGVTTVTGWSGYGCTRACDEQNFYPENLMGHTGPWDVDPVARLVLNLNSSATQARNLFGIGFYPWDPPTQDHDFARALRSVAPNYGDFPYIVEGGYDTLGVLIHVWQFTGPNLTPHNMARAAQTAMPQIGGYKNPSPWNGWTCCDPERVLVKYGAGDFSAVSDAREIYWDEKAISKNDGRPGAFVCPDGKCQRFEVGDFPTGNARKA